MALDLIKFSKSLEEHYTNEVKNRMVYENNPFLALVPKDETWMAKTIKVGDFEITRRKDYAIATLDKALINQSSQDPIAFIQATVTELTGAINYLTNSVVSQLYRDGFGSLGRVGSIVSKNTLTLSQPFDIINFEIGMEIQFSPTSGASVLRDSGNALTIIKVNRTNNVLTFLEEINNVVVNDFLFVKGDREDSDTPNPLRISGLDAWLPTTYPDSTPFFGVDRTINSKNVVGFIHDGSKESVLDSILNLAHKIQLNGGSPDYCFINFNKYGQLAKELGSVKYVDIKTENQTFIRGIEIKRSEGNTVVAIADHNCPSDKGYVLQMDTWVLPSLGKVIRIIQKEDQNMFFESKDSNLEARVASYSNLGCKTPGFNGVITF